MARKQSAIRPTKPPGEVRKSTLPNRLPNQRIPNPAPSASFPTVDGAGRLLPAAFHTYSPERPISEILAEIDRSTPDENDDMESWRQFRRNIDECRPHRPLFSDMND